MNERQAYLAIRNAIRLENLSDDVAQKVAPQLRAIFNELGKQFRRVPAGNIEREMWYRQQRLRIADMLAPLSVQMRNQLTQALGEEVGRQMHYAESYLRIAGEDPANLVAAAAPQDGVSLGFDPANAVAGRPQFTRTQLHAITQETRVLGERLEDLFEPTIGKGDMGPWIRQNMNVIDRVVKAGFLTGQTNDQLAEALSGATRESISRTRAIARTAVMSLSANAQEAFWDANSDVIKGWEFDASMDNRVCPQCAPWDGESRPERSKLPATPLHVSCRCRVLPLSASEMLLREEDGPQRRSVIELIDAPSKEAAIAKAKLKPGATEARAYASQVRVKGKKYWRVAVDIKKQDGPLTMGEFLKQASPITQSEVLGSNKRRGIFMRKITGDKNHPPMSPDRALKETVEWKPTVSRRPRMDAQLRLDIDRLKSQKEEMKRNAEGEAHIVYGYLRAKDSGTGKAGSPYYIGIGSSHTRAFEPHRRGGKSSKMHNVPVPKNEALIRQLGVFKTRAEAAAREQALIAQYGRKGIDPGGTLLNRTLGGDAGTLGLKMTAAQRERVIAANKLSAPARYRAIHQARAVNNAAKFGIDESAYNSLSQKERTAMRNFVNNNPGLSGNDWLQFRQSGIKPQPGLTIYGQARNGKVQSSARADQLAKAQLEKAAQKYGIKLEEWESMTLENRAVVRRRFKEGKRGAALTANLESSINFKMLESANKVGVSYETWVSLSPKGRRRALERYNRGKRGADLLKDLI